MGHWMVRNGINTRRNSPLKKVWALLFTCLSSRAVHIELLTHMDTSTLINALMRFIAIRGPCTIIRSDRGKNFVGAVNQDEVINFTSLNKKSVFNCEWLFNPPHASHFGGAWGSTIGQIRRSLDFSLLQLGKRTLCIDELYTFLLEAVSIVNSTPLFQIILMPRFPLVLRCYLQ
jgi:hypothetical protein